MAYQGRRNVKNIGGGQAYGVGIIYPLPMIGVGLTNLSPLTFWYVTAALLTILVGDFLYQFLYSIVVVEHFETIPYIWSYCFMFHT